MPVLEGAGGVISDWTGTKLTLENHKKSKGRVLASANSILHAQALEILNTPEHFSSGEDSAAAIDFDAVIQDIPPTILTKRKTDYGPLLFGMMVGEVMAHLGP